MLMKIKCAAIESGKRCPSVKFRVTADSGNECAPGLLQPELCGYDASVGSVVKGGERNERTTFTGGLKPGLGFADLFVLVRRSGDPFCDTHTHDRCSKSIYKSFFAFENHRYQQQSEFDAGREEKRNLGRAVGYVSIACASQHRVFYFSVLIFGTRARFMRWDRAGGIVTTAFDYRETPELLCEFLWRFHFANPVQRGYDPTVAMASRAEEELFRTSIRRHAAIQLCCTEADSAELDEALTLHYESGKVMRMQVYDRSRHSFRVYLVSVPLSSPNSAAGNSTRGYWAVESNRTAGEVHFVKDVWRIAVGNVREEGMVYEEMGKADVANICDLVMFGDVRNTELMDENDEVRRMTREADFL